MIMRDRKIGVAVIGLGVGAQHALAYGSTGLCQLRWVHDLDVEKARKMAITLEADGVAESYEQVLDDPDVQAVSIASYDDVHFDQVVAALNAGKHVFVEKPLCETVDELETVKRAWWKHEGALKLSSNLILRDAPIYRWLKQKIEDGDFGELYAFDGEYLYGRLQKITCGWRKNIEGYSVILGGAVHLVDLMLWLTGERPTEVYGAGNRISTKNTEFRYMDYVTATLQSQSGLVSRITANFGCVHRHQHVLRLFGTQATFLYDDAGPRMHVTRDPTVSAGIVSLPTLPATKGGLVGSFISAILLDEDISAHTQEIFDVISICDACDEAVEANSVVKVRYV